MSIRWKLLILLLLVGLVPLGFLTVFDQAGLRQLGQMLAVNARDVLSERSGEYLQQLIRDHATQMQIRREALELSVRWQAQVVERALRNAPNLDARIYFAEDYDDEASSPPDTAPSPTHLRRDERGAEAPMSVSFSAQAIRLAPHVNAEFVRGDVERLASITAELRYLRQVLLLPVCWQYTGLNSGVMASYPGHGGYPEDFDHREREWYRLTLAEGELLWFGPYVDASSGQLVITCATPVRDNSQAIVGATAMDVAISTIVQRMQIPTLSTSQARAMLVTLLPDPPHGTERPAVLARPGLEQKAASWTTPFEREWLESDDGDGLALMVEDMRAGRTARRRMPYLGVDSLWVYGPVDQRNTALVLIVPYASVIREAVAAENDVLRRLSDQLRVSGIIAVFVLLLVLLIALIASRAVTRPVRELVEAADRISRGELDARARIRSRDELGRLARQFNRMVPKLKEGLRLRQSIDLAMEVQQNLLPKVAPRIAGLDVAGRSIYCDETGGDYYDFLDLAELDGSHLGVAIGDVTGHGIAAALLMTTARAVLRSRAPQANGLGELMSSLNRFLTADMKIGRFMTLFYLVIDAERGQARWVSAGQDPALFFDPKSREFEELSGHDIPLGIEAAWRFQACGPVDLHPGNVIVLGTDGIWETRNGAGEFFGKDRLRDLIRENAEKPAAEIVTAITESLGNFRGPRQQEDDVTLVVIKRTVEEPDHGPRSA